ncbi:PAS domain-containing sensor histidine kinase [Rufibacter psychrotolerans]|uniref:PAS domain-containing sensor histidine kinase n=1 Tax=Rufibacter psychrotolerans TaxID=2812556 RepID=UPI001968636A|nr:ATP-binding protein [Rufibacter sp. SYSU D00308]
MHPSPELFQALIERTHQAFFVYDINAGRFTYQSPVFRATFPLPGDEIDPGALLAYIHQEDQAYLHECLQELIEQGSSREVEFRVQLPQLEQQWVCLNLALLPQDQAEPQILGHAEDITTQRQYNDHLKRFSNKKDSILNILSHDLAAPLGMIRNLTGLLAEELKDSSNEEVRHLLRLIEQGSQQGADLIREFMNQEFMESSQTHVVTRRVNMVRVLGEMLEEYYNARGELLRTRVSFHYSKPEIYAEIDDLKFMQAITNLISNALKFTPEEGTVTISLEEKNDGEILIKIADSGVGIPERYHVTLFDKFTPARRPGLRGEKSIGLGMSIVKTIVEWHKGEIWFESAENKGTTFFIKLPRSSAQ